jgi:hypothetical protein
MIRHKLRFLRSRVGIEYSQTRVGIAVTKPEIRGTLKTRAALNLTIETP